MDPLTIAALGTQAATGVFNTVSGAITAGKANRELRRLEKDRPQMQLQKPIMDNQALAESRAQTGLSDEALEIYRSSAQRGLSSSLGALIQSGGSMNNIGSLYSAYEGGVRKMAVLDDQMRAANAQVLMKQNDELAGHLDKLWQVNTYAPWANKMQNATQRATQGKQQFMNGIATIGSAAANAAAANQYEKEGNSVYGEKTTPEVPLGERQRSVGYVDSVKSQDEPYNAGQRAILGYRDITQGQQPVIRSREQIAAAGIQAMYPGLSGFMPKF